MPIIYDKLIQLMKDNKITSYTLKKDKIIGQATYKKIMEGGDIDTRTISKMCELLNCQPGDILQYVSDDLIENDIKNSPISKSEQVLKK